MGGRVLRPLQCRGVSSRLIDSYTMLRERGEYFGLCIVKVYPLCSLILNYTMLREGGGGMFTLASAA